MICNEWNHRIFCFKNQCASVWHIDIDQQERLPFIWKTGKFREEVKWNCSFRWKFSGKKVIPFEVLPFFHFYGNDRHFVYHLFGLPSARLHVERRRKIFYRYFENGTTQSRSCFLCQKEYQYHLTKNFHRNFCTNGKHSWWRQRGWPTWPSRNKIRVSVSEQ